MKKMAFPISVAALAGFFASQKPDGLDSVAQTMGFAHKAREGAGPLAGYHIPLLGQSKFSAAAAGVAGTLIVYAVFMLGLRLAKKYSTKHSATI